MKSTTVLVLASVLVLATSAHADPADDLRAVIGLGVAASGVATSGGNVAVATGEGVVNNFNPVIKVIVPRPKAEPPQVVERIVERVVYRDRPASPPPAPTFRSTRRSSPVRKPQGLPCKQCGGPSFRVSSRPGGGRGWSPLCRQCLASRSQQVSSETYGPPVQRRQIMVWCPRHGNMPTDIGGACVACVEMAQAQYNRQGYYGSSGPGQYVNAYMQMLHMQQMRRRRR